jgi:hypothetical protein
MTDERNMYSGDRWKTPPETVDEFTVQTFRAKVGRKKETRVILTTASGKVQIELSPNVVKVMETQILGLSKWEEESS